MASTIYYAGTSERRIAALKFLAAHSANTSTDKDEQRPVVSFDGGAEPDIDNVAKIMLGKITYALPGILASSGGRLNGDLVVAADARTSILVKNQTGSNVFESKGKPLDEAEAFKNFWRMAMVAQEIGFGCYQLISASGGVSKEQIRQATMTCSVKLTKKGMEYVETPLGFDEYVQTFEEFYKTPPYSNNSLTPISVEKVSAGISLPVLKSMGFVQEINGIDQLRQSPAANQAFKLGLLTVAVGFSPKVLEMLHPRAISVLLQWEWLNQIIDKVK